MRRRTSVILVVVTALALSVISIFLVYSASRRNYGISLAVRQSVWTVLGVFLAYIVTRISRKQIMKFRWLLYGGALFLLILTQFIGVSIRGERSWLDFGLFHVQSAEAMKLAIIVVFAGVSNRLVRDSITLRRGLMTLLALFLPPVLLILLQPDLGTVLIYLGFFVCWIFLLGLWREAAAIFALGIGLFTGLLVDVMNSLGTVDYIEGYLFKLIQQHPLFIGFLVLVFYLIFLIYPYAMNRRIRVINVPLTFVVSVAGGMNFSRFLESYQIQRLKVYLDPYEAPLRSGYNVIQSQIAIGSGGWFGKGYLSGSQSQLGFIPELWTDFIFSVSVEELGLFFGLILIGLIFLLVYSSFSVAAQGSDWTAYFVCSGIGLFWILHSIVNLGVCVGIVPVIGLPLPFVSYGGSFMVINWLLVGLLISFSRRGVPQTHFTRGESSIPIGKTPR